MDDDEIRLMEPLVLFFSSSFFSFFFFYGIPKMHWTALSDIRVITISDLKAGVWGWQWVQGQQPLWAWGGRAPWSPVVFTTLSPTTVLESTQTHFCTVLSSLLFKFPCKGSVIKGHTHTHHTCTQSSLSVDCPASWNSSNSLSLSPCQFLVQEFSLIREVEGACSLIWSVHDTWQNANHRNMWAGEEIPECNLLRAITYCAHCVTANEKAPLK